ncbi:MAG TPA: hypothetical protein V6C57_19250 [Coleofasciculaceae cyanobacterium]
MTDTTHSAYTVSTLAQIPDLQPQIESLHDMAWPRYICEFMRKDAVINHYWTQLHQHFADYQILIYDSAKTLIALGHTIPVQWDRTLDGLPAGWEDVLKRGIDHRTQPANTLSALAAIVHPHYQKQGLSQVVIKSMRRIATVHQFADLIAPVRPILKHQYPLIPMQNYVNWQQAELPFDPWMRVHAKLGADILCVAPASMVISAPVAQWHDWTGLHFPGSGSYIIPGALQPLTINCEQDRGTYQEANVWMRHAVA